MHHNALVPLPQVTTSDYPEGDRTRLGIAVTRAREAAGWMRRKDLAERANISLRSLAKLEGGDAGVGRLVLEAVGRALPEWTEDTPGLILAGGEPPPTGTVVEETTRVDADDSEEDHTEWSEEDERKYQLLKAMLRSQGLEMTPRILRIMKEEFDRLEAEQLATEQATQGEHS